MFWRDRTRKFDWLTPWADTPDRLLVTDYSVTDISALAKFTNLERLELFTGRQASGTSSSSTGSPVCGC